MAFTTTRAVIFGKTYPEPSNRYTETVCTGAIRTDDGRPIRLYPVPLRYLTGDQQYKLWDIVEVDTDRSSKDQRPESFKIDPAKLQVVGHLDTDPDGWRQRRELIDRDRSWHFTGMESLKAANRAHNTSIGLVRPGRVDDVELCAKPHEARVEFERKCAELRAMKESDMFDPQYQTLDFLDNEIFLLWRCETPCKTCQAKPHRMKVLDWGLMQLARKKGWEAALEKMRIESDLAKKDFRLILGNFAQHPRNFGVIALWYPTIPEQMSLL